MKIPGKISFSEVNTPETDKYGISVYVARFDKVHPVISGNKLYKVHYFLEKAKQQSLHLVTYGGAFSNHLVATAFACKEAGVRCTGIVRGEEPKNWSATLKDCYAFGMNLRFASREEYRKRAAIFEETKEYIRVPEGGYHPLGAKGASLMAGYLNEKCFTHIICSAGTATMLAGLLLGNKNNAEIIVSPAIKNMHDIGERLYFLTGKNNWPQLAIWGEYHQGGYAKKNDSLIQFMNAFFTQTGIETDIIYTGKMMYGVMDKIKQGYFKEGSKIACIHSGGLQGNASLAKGALTF